MMAGTFDLENYKRICGIAVCEKCKGDRVQAVYNKKGFITKYKWCPDCRKMGRITKPKTCKECGCEVDKKTGWCGCG